MLGIDEKDFVSCSNGWLDSFKSHHLLKEFRFHGEATSVSEAGVLAARERLQKLLEGHDRKDIFNMDEMGLYYRMPPSKGLATKQMAG